MGCQWSLAAYYRSILMCSVLCPFFLLGSVHDMTIELLLLEIYHMCRFLPFALELCLRQLKITGFFLSCSRLIIPQVMLSASLLLCRQKLKMRDSLHSQSKTLTCHKHWRGRSPTLLRWVYTDMPSTNKVNAKTSKFNIELLINSIKLLSSMKSIFYKSYYNYIS